MSETKREGLFAPEGKLYTDGTHYASVVFPAVGHEDDWYLVDASEAPKEEENLPEDGEL